MPYEEIKEQIGSLPEEPGVYLMKDSKGQVLYVGKAKNLRNRVSSYFQSGDTTPAQPNVQVMTTKIANVEYITAESEIDALLMEARLIKDIQPKYNVQLKDDKTFPLLAIIKNDDFPKVAITREITNNSEYYGPFTDAEGLRETVKLFQKIFKFATCNLTIVADDEKRRFFRPCILYSIKRCTAPCADKISKGDYSADMESFRQLLIGSKDKLITELKNKMQLASKKQEYERAGQIRDQIKALESLAKHSLQSSYIEGDLTPIEPKVCMEDLTKILGADSPIRTIEGVDIANIAGTSAVGSVVTFVDGIPFKSGYRRFKIKTVNAIDDYAMIREVVNRRFNTSNKDERELPNVLLIDGGIGHLNSAAEELSRINIRLPFLLSLAKKEETPFLYTAGKGATEIKVDKASMGLRLLMYVRDEAHRFAQHYHHILHKKATFGE